MGQNGGAIFSWGDVGELVNNEFKSLDDFWSLFLSALEGLFISLVGSDKFFTSGFQNFDLSFVVRDLVLELSDFSSKLVDCGKSFISDAFVGGNSLGKSSDSGFTVGFLFVMLVKGSLLLAHQIKSDFR